LVAQIAAYSSQITNITALAFCLFALTINRMLALLVFNKAKGIGSASNKRIKALASSLGHQNYAAIRFGASPKFNPIAATFRCPLCGR